jgi:hypothetical protein
MAQSNPAQFHPATAVSFKPLLAIKAYLNLLADAFTEAKVMEQKSRRTSGNW